VDKDKLHLDTRIHMEGYYHATYHIITQDPTRSAQYITCKEK
jgi:hypothetical protein